MDLSSLNLTTDQLIALKAQLAAIDTSGRSPLRPRQLHDLRLAPTADDPRPTFFWSAVSPRHAADLTRTAPYPRLMWDGATGREITVADAKDEAAHVAQGFVLAPPANAEAPDLAESVRQQLDLLSPEDRKTLIQAAQGDKLARLREAMAGLTDDELASLVSTMEPARAKKTA